MTLPQLFSGQLSTRRQQLKQRQPQFLTKNRRFYWKRRCNTIIVVLSVIVVAISCYKGIAALSSTSMSTASSDLSSANAAIGAEENSHQPPLNVALLGAGLFASTAHAPVLQKYPNIFNCVAVYSRRLEVASKLASTLSSSSSSSSVVPYTDVEQVLQIPNLDAVIMALPLDVQPQFIPKCLKAGVHVLSEKPIGPNVEVGKQLLHEYQSILANRNNQKQHLVWSVAENYRYEPALKRAARAIMADDEIGKPLLFSLNVRAPFLPNNKYLNTPWRNKPTWGDGGLFVDAFVHASAMLRMILPVSSPAITTKVAAVTSSNAEHIPGVDTMVSNVIYNDSNNNNDDDDTTITGSISATYACSTMKFEFEVVGTNGTLLLSRNTDKPGYHLKVESLMKKGKGKEKINWENDYTFGGIEQEFLAFAAYCQQQRDEFCNTPLEAIKDLAFVEACLVSGQKNGKAVVVDDMFKR